VYQYDFNGVWMREDYATGQSTEIFSKYECVLILTLQGCVWFVHRLAADTEHTTPSMRERGASRIAGCRSFQKRGVINLVSVNVDCFLKSKQFSIQMALPTDFLWPYCY
jgi:hypothetical protein